MATMNTYSTKSDLDWVTGSYCSSLSLITLHSCLTPNGYHHIKKMNGDFSVHLPFVPEMKWYTRKINCINMQQPWSDPHNTRRGPLYKKKLIDHKHQYGPGVHYHKNRRDTTRARTLDEHTWGTSFVLWTFHDLSGTCMCVKVNKRMQFGSRPYLFMIDPTGLNLPSWARVSQTIKQTNNQQTIKQTKNITNKE